MADEIKDDPFRGFLQAMAGISAKLKLEDNIMEHDFKVGDNVMRKTDIEIWTICDILENGEQLECQSTFDGRVHTFFWKGLKLAPPIGDAYLPHIPKATIQVDASNWGESRTAAIEAAKHYMDNGIGHPWATYTPVMSKLETDNVHAHLEVCGELNVTYERKNADYGDSFAQSLDKHGLIASIVRMDDKLNRVTSLNNSGDIQVTDESLRDTVMDLANYAIMTVMWMDSIKEEHKKIDIDEEYRLGRHPKYDIYADNLELTGADYDGDAQGS